jgi:STE24 endopeptidase
MNEIFYLLVALLIFDFLLDTVVDLVNLRAVQPGLPPEFVGVYDAKKYAESQRYLVVNTKFGLVQSSFSLLTTLAFIFLGGFNHLDIWVRSFGFGEIYSGLAFMGSLMVMSGVAGLPFSIYRTFVIEEKFGFNRTTVQTFLLDLIKGIILGAILGGGILALVLWFFASAGSLAWVYAWVAILVLQLLLQFLAPAFLMPLFNKFEPLPPGELKDAIEALAKKLGFQLNGLFTMDGSKRSAKANAFFTGFGRFRRIVLFDTLVAKHSVPELVGVLAHEIGHYRLKHIHRMFILSVASTGLLFFFLSQVMGSPKLFEAMGMESMSLYAGLIFAALFFSPVNRVFSLLFHYFSRKHEFEADAFAAKESGDASALSEALKKLSVENLSNLHPHRWKVWLDYTHPPVLERLRALAKL